MTQDPPVRKDNLCSYCAGPRRMPSNHLKGVDPAVYELDCFCSTACAKAYYDVATQTINRDKKRGYVDHVAEKEARVAA